MKSSSRVHRFALPMRLMIVLGAFLSMLVAPAAGAAPVLPACIDGGRIVVNSGDTLDLSDCMISGHSTRGAGGGVYNSGTMTLTRVVVTGNHSDLGGGGIYNGGTMTLVDVIVTDNTAGGMGGGIHNDGGTIYMSNTTITGNTAGTGGGGIANTRGSAIGVAIAVTGNTATTGNGGGVYNNASMCFAEGAPEFEPCFTNPTGGNSLISGNTASAGGGGGVANDCGTVSLADSTIDGNHAQIVSSIGGDGGGVWNSCGTTELLRVTISNNMAAGNGGGIFNDGGSVCCIAGTNYDANLTIAGNTAAGAGGGAYTKDGSTILGSSTIADNSAASGGGVYNSDPTMEDAGGFTGLKDTLLARNGNNCFGTIQSDGHNLDTGDSCAFTGDGDQPNVGDANVGLGTLAANGGPTQGSTGVFAAMKTLALTSSSPAVDHGSNTCPANDERGISRPQDGNGDTTAACDIGAFELQSVCPAGSFSATGFTPCTPAPAGSFATGPGAISATQCAPGTFSAAAGAAACTPAPAGSFATGPGAISATQCAPGTFSAAAGAAACTPAPAGSFATGPGATSATQCAPGTFSAAAGVAACTPAPAGSFATGPGAISATQCAPGTFSAAAGAAACTPAPAGSFATGPGAISATQCAPGTFSAAAGAAACTPCPAGQSSGVGATACQATGLHDQLASIGSSLAPYASNAKVKQAIDSINKAFDSKYWADGNTLTKDGQNVFNLAHDAINNLLAVTSPPVAVSAAQAAITNLVKLCRDVVATAIQYAIDHGGNAKEISLAQQEMTAAQSDLDKGHPDSATTHYGNGWLHAWKAVH